VTLQKFGAVGAALWSAEPVKKEEKRSLGELGDRNQSKTPERKGHEWSKEYLQGEVFKKSNRSKGGKMAPSSSNKNGKREKERPKTGANPLISLCLRQEGGRTILRCVRGGENRFDGEKGPGKGGWEGGGGGGWEGIALPLAGKN